ncbi:DNA topoisomerase 6 subunit B [Carex littledalei]|uniref:DNA topoisomerase 6 subunit B n=1 Tax=Carex littledalei TaxID=544730 RepID=A0A833V669_9POAL|nr:DNA topoisomerase 6 subunit B [Carex littledalei]
MESDGSYASSDEPKKKPNRGKPKKNPSSSSTAKNKSKDTSLLKQKSPAEFFAENKNIAGFDNPGKSLYTTVREFVENSLDSAESISEAPSIEITIEEINKSKFNTLIGLVDRERVDQALYDGFESNKAREKRLAKEAKIQESQAKNLALGKKVKESVTGNKTKSRGETAYFKVTCKDNGKGMPHDDIPNMFGRVLSGTKYGLRQTRGKFGLGAKMALIWSKMSTGLPIEITSSMKGQNFTSFCRLDIDIHKNIPHVHLHEKRENKDRWHGAEIHVIIEGNWTTHRSKVLQYMRQMAVITPYAEFLVKFISDTSEKNMTIRFARRTDVMPPVPLETKYHPSAVDLLLIKRLISETSKQNLQQFLQHEFLNISKSHAERLIGEMGPDFSPKMAVKSLTSQQIVRIHQLFREARFDDPSGDAAIKQCCSQLKSKIVKKLQARERQERKRNLNRYIPDACRAVMEVIEQIANEGRGSKRHKKYEKEDEDLIEKVASEQVTDVTLRDCLTQHVEQVDYEMALEYATQSGVSEEPREDIYLNSLEASYNFTDFHSPVFVFRLVS